MGAKFDEITERQTEFIQKQKWFFVASAPLHANGTVNMSPKGYDAFRILDKNTVMYVDLTGSGIETIAHMREKNNGRITFMFVATEGPPLIVRLYGKGKFYERGTPEYEKHIAQYPEAVANSNAARAIVVAKIHRTHNSCGYGVPYMDFVKERSTLLEKALANKGPISYMEEPYLSYNAYSQDGLPGRVEPVFDSHRETNPPAMEYHMGVYYTPGPTGTGGALSTVSWFAAGAVVGAAALVLAGRAGIVSFPSRR